VARAGLEPASRAHEAREVHIPPPREVWLAGLEPALSGARHRRVVQSSLQPDDEENREEGFASLNRGRSRRSIYPGTIRCPSALLPATVVTARGMPCPLSKAGCTLRPTLRAAVVPSLPGAARRRPNLPTPPAGFEPAPSGLRARRHRRSTTGACSRLRRQDSNDREPQTTGPPIRSDSPATAAEAAFIAAGTSTSTSSPCCLRTTPSIQTVSTFRGWAASTI
jgi:hypothetical protein